MVMFKMREFAAVLAVLCFGSAAAAQPFCLDSRNIRDSRARDSHTVVFRMIDGSRYRATLTRDCPGLNFNGFTIFPADSDRVCEGIQTIRILKDHQVCQIGSITPMPPPVH